MLTRANKLYSTRKKKKLEEIRKLKERKVNKDKMDYYSNDKYDGSKL